MVTYFKWYFLDWHLLKILDFDSARNQKFDKREKQRGRESQTEWEESFWIYVHVHSFPSKMFYAIFLFVIILWGIFHICRIYLIRTVAKYTHFFVNTISITLLYKPNGLAIKTFSISKIRYLYQNSLFQQEKISNQNI